MLFGSFYMFTLKKRHTHVDKIKTVTAYNETGKKRLKLISNGKINMVLKKFISTRKIKNNEPKKLEVKIISFKEHT